MNHGLSLLRQLLAVTLTLLSLAVNAQTPPPYGLSINIEQAKKAMAAAEAEARKNNWQVVISIVDTGGHLVMVQRGDAQHASVDIAPGKARTAVTFRRPTKALEDGKVESLNLIIKGDVSGAVEALEESLMKIEVDDSVQLRILHRGVGAITESDVDLATIDNAIVIGFNVRPDVKARERAAREGIDIRFYNVIYNAIDDIEQSLTGMLKPEYEEIRSGVAEIREVFRSSKIGNIAGVIVRNGTITRNAKARVIRDGVVIADGLAIESLRRFKDDVTEVRTDFECGIGLGKFNDIQIGDEIETTEMVEKPRA